MTGSNDSSRVIWNRPLSSSKNKRVITVVGTLGEDPSGSHHRKYWNRIPLRDGKAKSGWRLLDLTISPIEYEANSYNQDWTVVVGFTPQTLQPVMWDFIGSNVIGYAQLIFGAGALFGSSTQINDGLVIPCDIFIGAKDSVAVSADPTGINYVMHLEKVPLGPVEFSLECLQVLSAFDSFGGPYP